MTVRKDRVDDQAVADVLAELRALRLRMSADLAAASGAIETDEAEVAADILDGDSADLGRFLMQSRDRLAAAALEDAGADPNASPDESGVVPLQRRRSGWRRALPALPAVALLAGSAAAAAVVAPRLGDGPKSTSPAHRPAAAQQASAIASQPPAAFRQLRSAIIGHASAKEVLTAAQRWHQHLAVLIAASRHDPHRLGMLISLLQQETHLLRSHHVPDAQAVLAAASRLEQHLLRTAAPLLSSLPVTFTSPPAGGGMQPHPRTSHRHSYSAQPLPTARRSAPSKPSHPSRSTSHSPTGSAPSSPSPSSSWTPPWQAPTPGDWLTGRKH